MLCYASTIDVHLSCAVAAVNEDIGTSDVRASVRRQQDIGALQLGCLCITSHVDAASLGHVVRGLFLWEVGNVAGHRGGDDQAAGLALPEVQTNGPRAVEDTIQIGLNDLIPCLHGAVEDIGVTGPASIGNEDIDLAKVLNDRLDRGLNVLVLAHVELVRLGLDAVLVRQLLCVLLAALGTRAVRDGNVGAHFSAATCGLSANASWAGRAGDDDDLALEGKHLLEGVALWWWDRHVEN